MSDLMMGVIIGFLAGSGIGAWCFVLYLSVKDISIPGRRAVSPKASALAE